MQLPQKIRSSRLPLGIKLTLFFTVFGVCIAYITFVLFTTRATHDLMNHYRSNVTDFFSTHDRLTMELLKKGTYEEFVREVPVLRDVSALQQSLVQVSLFKQNPQTGEWKRIAVLTKDQTGELRDRLKTKEAQRFENKLAQAGETGFARETGLFYGRSDLFSFFIRVASDDSILKFTMSRKGFSDILGNPVQSILLFTLAIALISLILSQLFVQKIIKPINWLAKTAARAAEGDRSVKFTLKGSDSIARLSRMLDHLMQENTTHIARIQKQSDTLETMNHIDRVVLSSVSRRDLMKRVTNFTAALYPENGVVLLLKHSQKNSFQILTQPLQRRGEEQEYEDSILPDEHIGAEIEAYLQTSSLKHRELAALPEEITTCIPESTVWLLNNPIYVKNTFYGSLIVSSDLTDGFSEEETDLVAKLADQIGVALQSLLQVEEKENLLYGSLKALSASIDAKSRWTAGHSERVHEVAEIIGRAMRLSAAELNQLSIAALLHDIGKLGIPEQVLDKPGALTDEEYALIKTHPETGAEIFGHIPDNPEVLDGIRYHHEQWAGGGYPAGLKGEAIPMIARILCIADVYDALSADRPYRAGMSYGEILIFFQEKKAVMFDPHLTDLFLELLQSGRV